MKLVVIGASAAGLKAACRVRRLRPDAEVTVVEEGSYIAWAGCGLPYYLSSDIDDFNQLLMTPYNLIKDHEYFAHAKGVAVLTNLRAESIDAAKKIVHCRNVRDRQTCALPYDELVLATGAMPNNPMIAGSDLPGVGSFTRPEDALGLRRAIEKQEIGKVAIIGAGFIGCELCEAFKALWGIDTELFEQAGQVLPDMLDPEMGRIVELELQRQGVGLHLGRPVESLQVDGHKLKVILPGESVAGFDRVILATGLKPRTELAQTAGAKIGSTSGIMVDSRLHTSIPHIFAAGDCVELTHAVTGKPCLLPLGSLANRMGRIAGTLIGGDDDWLSPVVGSTCLKVFDMNTAAVGLTAREAAKAGFKVGQVWGSFTDKSHYYPEAQIVSAVLNFDLAERRILGVQAVGRGDVTRRIDAASLMIQQNRTIGQIWDFEPAYAPPYATPLDPLHYLAYAAIAMLDEDLRTISPLDFPVAAGDCMVLDVREEVEVNSDPLQVSCRRSIQIPFPQVRGRMGELPGGEKIITVCHRGTRSAEIARLLQANHFAEVRYVGGGLGFFQN